nr:FAD-dependent monooxygenase [Brucella intermedia]
MGVVDQVVAAVALSTNARAKRTVVIQRRTWASALMVPQFLTEKVIRDRLSELGHQVEFGVEFVAFEQDEECVTVQLSGSSGQ